MEEILFVSFDNNERKDECGLCVFKKHKNGKIEVLKMELDEQAKILYKLLRQSGGNSWLFKTEMKAYIRGFI